MKEMRGCVKGREGQRRSAAMGMAEQNGNPTESLHCPSDKNMQDMQNIQNMQTGVTAH